MKKVVARRRGARGSTANTCQHVSGDGKSSSAAPNAAFKGGVCKVNKVSGISTANVKVNQK